MKRDFIGQTAIAAVIQGLLTEDAHIGYIERDLMKRLEYENEN
jgi:hypothetical protein